MKYLKTALLSVALTLSGIAVYCQTVDEIIDQYIIAVGGKEKLSQVKSLYIEGSTEIMGNQAPSTIQIVHNKGYKNEMDFNGTKVITVYSDKGGWTVNPMMNMETPTAIPADIVKKGQIQMDATSPLFDYVAKGNKVELLGKEAVNGSTAYKLKVTSKENEPFTYFIDSATHYMSKMVFNIAEGQDLELVYSNFKKTDFGLVMPFTQVLNMAGLVITTTQSKIDINKEIDLSVFEMPGKQVQQ